MQRRRLLALGAVSAAVLAIGGGSVALMQPGLMESRLSPAARDVFAAIGRAVLDGSLPAEPAAAQAAMQGLIERIDSLVAALPPHAQAELSQLLSLLASSGGRRALAGLSAPWSDAATIDIQEALQSMRVSRISLRQQAYHALHDIVGGAYFSHAQTWAAIGYPGPARI